MRADLLNQLTRIVVLVLLLGYFAYSLVHGLVLEEREKGFGANLVSRQDPGVRVLLTNRGPPDPIPGWDRLEIHILQPVEVINPDEPDEPTYHLTLHGGAVLHVQPDVNPGFVLNAREWGKDYTWPGRFVRILPVSTDPQAPILADGSRQSSSRRDPCQFESRDHDAVFSLAGAVYRGSLEIGWHSAKDVEAINCLPMEAYVEGVVAVEMSPAFPLQALKAQAVVSRSYAYAHEWLSRHGRREYDVLDTGDDQEYRGTGKGNDLVRAATEQTRGMCLLVGNDRPFAPLFCASSGGYTESIDNVLPGATDVFGEVPLNTVMLSQPDRFCRPGCEALGDLSTHWTSVTVLTPDELRRKLAKLNAPEDRPIGFLRSVRAGRRDPQSGRVLSVLIGHTMSSVPVEMTAHSFRMMVGPNLLRSTLWSADSPVALKSDTERVITYQITTTGFGHGVGMSQVSAYEMAQENYSFLEILHTFYLRTSIRALW